MFFQVVKHFKAQRSGVEILSLALTQILVVVIVGVLISRSRYYVSYSYGLGSCNNIGRLLSSLEVQH
jgi:hypothetical protein